MSEPNCTVMGKIIWQKEPGMLEHSFTFSVMSCDIILVHLDVFGLQYIHISAKPLKKCVLVHLFVVHQDLNGSIHTYWNEMH